MVRVLVLTKNILAEKIITNKLQHLNYEVFCSTSILNEIQMEGHISELINHFPIIIVGEMISNYEMDLMLPRLKQYNKSILREVDHYLNEDDRAVLLEQGVTGTVQNNDSSEVLREQMAEIAAKYQDQPFGRIATEKQACAETDSEFLTTTLINLSSLELQVVNKLRSQPGEIISRNELCVSLWGAVSQSRLAQLSSLVKSAKLKLENSDIDQGIIQTVWGKGYRVCKDSADQSGERIK